MSAEADANKILAQVIDKVDDILFKHGLSFKDDEDWEDAVEELRAFVEKYYDDNEADEDEGEVAEVAEKEPSDAETLSSEEEEDDEEDEEDEEVEIAPKKRARK